MELNGELKVPPRKFKVYAWDAVTEFCILDVRSFSLTKLPKLAALTFKIKD